MTDKILYPRLLREEEGVKQNKDVSKYNIIQSFPHTYLQLHVSLP